SAQYTQPVVTGTGKRVAAPDLRQDKQLILLALLLNGRYSSEWFRTGDLMRYLSGTYSKTAQIRCQMEKLRVRGFIEKRQHSHYYRVTKAGYVWMYASYCQIRYLVNPLLSKGIECRISPELAGLDVFEAAINSIHSGLSTIYQQLNMVA
ncbi:MAG: hypothetical protein D4R56_00935, partial [Deltaproteobacteria bacterium]